VATFTASAVDCISAADQTCLPPNVGGQPANSYAVAHASFTDTTAYEADREYTVQVVGKDAAGNGATVSRNFTWDVTPSSSGLERPASAARLRSLSLVSGTAQDGWSVYHTSISIRSANNGKCYNPVGIFDQDCPYWIGTSSAPNNPPYGAFWSYADANLNTTLGLNATWYTIISRSIDTARNEQGAPVADVSSRTFIFDNAAPNVSVSFPAHLGAGAIGKYQRDLIGGAAHPFTGTAVDPNAPWDSGIRRVEIDISYFDGTDTWYWITDNWSSGTWANNNKWFVTTGISWQSIAAPAWPVGADRQYRIEVRAEDASYLSDGTASGNVSAPSVVGTDIHDFIVDDTLPTVLLQQPASGDMPALASISGTANGDLSGLSKVEVRIQRIAGGADEDWTGSSWTALNDHYSTATLSGITGNANWSYTDLSGAFTNNQVYRLFLQVTDLAGHVRTAPVGGDRDFKYDQSAPSLAISFPASPPAVPAYSNDAINAEAVRISTYTWGTVSDPGTNGSGISEVWVAVASGASQNIWWSTNTNTFSVNQAVIYWSSNVYISGTQWAYAPAEWRIPGFSDNVTYTVFVRARDKAGNWTSVQTLPGAFEAGYKQQFKYDVTRPTAAVSAPVNGSEQNAASLIGFSGQATDSGDGLSGVSHVYAAIQHVDGTPAGELGKYWDWTSGFSVGSLGAPPSAGWTQVSSTSLDNLYSLNWSTSVPAGMLVSSNTYRVVTVALDKASNLQQNPAAAGAGAVFHYDVQAPTAAFTAPKVPAAPALEPYFNAANLVAIAGTADDRTTGGSGLTSVEILLKAEDLEATWRGTLNGDYGDWDDDAGTKYGQWLPVSGSLLNWTKSVPNFGTELDSRRLRLWVRAQDRANNISPVPTNTDILNNDNAAAAGGGKAWTFTYDNSAPASRVVYPPRYVNFTPATITGTSAEAYPGRSPSGVSNMALRYQRSDNKFWSLVVTDWIDADTIGSTSWDSNDTPWSFSAFNAAAFEDGFQYKANSRARDRAGNYETNLATHTFTVDRSTPLSQVAFPAHNGFSSAYQISGTAEDRFCILQPALCDNPVGRHFESGLDASSVTVAVRRVEDDKYWDGSGFNASDPVWSTAAFVGDSSGTWTYNLPSAGSFASPKNYEASCRVVHDRAGNIQTVITTNTFTFDTTPPVGLATGPVGSLASIPYIYGTARDDSPGVLQVVRVRLQEANDCADPIVPCNNLKYWNGAGWQAGEVWLSSGVIGSLVVDSTYSWKWNMAGVAWNNQTSYFVTVRSEDKAGNVEAVHTALPDITFKLETPQATVAIVNPPGPDGLQYGPNTGAPAVNLSGTGTNLRLSQGVKIILRRLTEPTSYWNNGSGGYWTNDPAVFTWVDVVDGAPQTWNLALNGPYGVDNASYSVQAVAMNNSNQQGGSATRGFVYDRIKPTGGITSPSGAACAGVNACINSWPQLSGTFQDPGNVEPPSITQPDVNIRIKRVVDGYYWNGADFVDPAPDPAEFGIAALGSAGSPPTFSWSTTTRVSDMGKLNDGTKYSIIAHAQDRAGNDMGDGTDESAMARFTVLFDTTPPTAYMVQPSSGEVYQSLAAVMGTSADHYGNANKDSDLERVEISIRYNQDDVCWSETEDQFKLACPHFFAASGVAPWSYANASITGQLTNGKLYTITVRGVDKAGNNQTEFTVPGSSRSWAVDKNPPSAGFTKPQAGTAYRTGQLTGGSAITGTASDPEAALYPDNDALLNGELVMWYLAGDTSYYYTGVPNKAPSSNGTKFSSNTVESAEWQSVSSTDDWKFLFQSG
ncbi:MAG: Ig-like domain-containing protein, partial [Elusimicrobiota bacterium]